jgi:hypothetical protein
VDDNYLDLGMKKSGFVHTLPSGRLTGGWERKISSFPRSAPRPPTTPRHAHARSLPRLRSRCSSAQHATLA